MKISLQQKASILESDLETPVGLFMRLVGEKYGILLESAAVDGTWGRYSIIATDFLLHINNNDDKLDLDILDSRFDEMKELIGLPFVEGLRTLIKTLEIKPDQEISPQAPITRALYGYLGYGLVSLFNPKLQTKLPAKDACLGLALPGTVIIFDHIYNRITKLSLLDSKIKLKEASKKHSNIPSNYHNKDTIKEEYINNVIRAKDLINQGEAVQLVLSAHFQAQLKEDTFTLYRRLRRLNPSPYMFYMNLPDGTLLGSSPELMISCDGGNLRLCPIAGTRHRSDDSIEDALLADELLSDPKDQAEHVMLVDLGRNDLSEVAEIGSVKLERYMELERFSHVMHLTSRIQAKLRSDCDAVDVIKATFPAGTVSGAPKQKSFELIADLEKIPRAAYAGAIGWIGLDKDAIHLDFGIAIRSLWANKNKIYWQAGAGIISESKPEAEWQECLNKSKIMRTILNDVK
ncbi:anthranilate synthase component I family protein [Desulfovibrio litoralis]|uniref:Anthranilate synthase, component I n=1 Tax=Desulfovibrio litoralis DSM 11393 TaxID=1121455 RepID=A0A1M7RWK4_9BACT|nr:anthranilate synthase component I family protein [Desulfovibrio litoralis]SHN50620.1 anthranilate synthase, component I [Desulfovibrio litoralis DSM 11393]